MLLPGSAKDRPLLSYYAIAVPGRYEAVGEHTPHGCCGREDARRFGEIVERQAEGAFAEHDCGRLVAGVALSADFAPQSLAAACRRVDVDVEEAAIPRFLVGPLARLRAASGRGLGEHRAWQSPANIPAIPPEMPAAFAMPSGPPPVRMSSR